MVRASELPWFTSRSLSQAHADFLFPELETLRLRLRVLTLGDVESVFHHFADDQVTQFMDIDPCTRLEEARDIIDFHLKDAGCRWGLFAKDTGALVGTCGYHAWERERGVSMAEIGFDLAKAHWGQGLMREALQTVVPFGFEGMQLSKIYASVEPENERSIGLLERLAFQSEPTLRDGLRWFSRFPGEAS